MIDFRIKAYLVGSDYLRITNNETKYKLEDITGLNGFERNVNLLELAGQDGSVYGSRKIPSREIVATISLVGDVENNRLALIRELRSNNGTTLYFNTDNRRVFIDGIAKTADINAFSEKQAGQIAFTCENPFFHSRDNTETDIDKGSGYTTVTNNGDVPVGFQVKISLTSITGNPTKLEVEKKIGSSDFRKIIINYSDGFESGDLITIENSFRNNNKTVTLKRNNQSINLISSIDRVSTQWFNLDQGSNFIRYRIGGNYSYSGSYSCLLTHRADYLSL